MDIEAINNVKDICNHLINNFLISKVNRYYDETGYLLTADGEAEHHIFIRHNPVSNKSTLKIMALNHYNTADSALRRLYLQYHKKVDDKPESQPTVLENLANILEINTFVEKGGCQITINSQLKDKIDVVFDITNITEKTKNALNMLFKVYGLKPNYA